METIFLYILFAAAFVGLVYFGFWTITRAGLPRAAAWTFGILVLIVIVFILMYLARGEPLNLPR